MERILIIGGGIAGLTAGIYAQKSGFESVIFEKHSILGGECTGWDRNGYHIDGCIHWLTGTKEGDVLNKLWKQVGALENVDIYNGDTFMTIEYQNKQINIYRDLNLLRDHFLEISPEDKSEIDKFIACIRTLESAGIPAEKPFDMMNIWEILKYGISMKDIGKIEKELSKKTIEEYCSKFKSPLIRKALTSLLPAKYNASSLMFSLATFTGGNGGWPAGGSRAMAQRMEKKYLELGGKVKTNTEVQEIIIENGAAKALKTRDGSIESGTYIVPACDSHITLKKLLKGRYTDKELDKRYADSTNNPIESCVYISLAVDADLKDYPEKLIFETAPITCGSRTYHELFIHHYCHEPFAPEGKSIITCSLSTEETDYLYWKTLKQDQTKYKEEKTNLANKVIAGIEERFKELKGKIAILDVATPVTYERYCGAYQGAWMSFMTTPTSERMMHSGKIKGIENLYMTGQWLLPPGGLPVALITGKWTIQRICKKEKLAFQQ